MAPSEGVVKGRQARPRRGDQPRSEVAEYPCAYAPGFLEALRTVVRAARARSPLSRLDPISRRQHLIEVNGASQAVINFHNDPAMCDKFLLLDMREPFVEDSVSEDGDEPLGP